jgi:uncharacterized repeat protein (TIGR02543 family)
MKDSFLKSSLRLVAVALAGFSIAYGGALTADEVLQIETAFGITLTETQKQELAAVVKPDAPLAQWRTDAEARIDTHRKADLQVQVVDSEGTPVDGAAVDVKMRASAFKFGGTFKAKDFAGVTLPGTMTTTTYKDRLLSLFNAVGLSNGLKPRLDGIHQYIPGVLSWTQANNLPVRGHLLLWPGTGDIATMDTPGTVAGTDYGRHLSDYNNNSAYASYNVLGAVETYRDSGRTQADKDALEAVVDAEVAEWAGHWDVYEWDVINETLSNYLLQEIMGADQMAEWFRIAETNKVSADCKLFINDYQIISCMSEGRTPGYYTNPQGTGRRDRYMANIDQIISDGGPIDGIGFQSRIKSERRDPQLIYDRLEEWGNAYGLEMVGTEFEVVSSNPGDWKEYIYTDEERAQITEEMVVQYYSHPLVTGLNAWNTIHDGEEALVDYSGNPTRNGLVWYYVHRIRYTTDEALFSDVAGSASVRAFKGDYDITVSYGGNDYPASLTLSSNQTVQVTLHDVVVNPGDDPPVANNDSYTMLEGRTTVLDPLANDNDPEGQPLDLVSFSQPTYGSVTNNGDGTLTHIADPGYVGADSFTYSITDGTLTSEVATVSLTINPNSAPVAVNDGASTLVDTLVNISVMDNDSDPDGDPIGLNAFTQGANGTVSDNGDGTLRYTPNSGYTGADSFTYTVTDGLAVSASATVSVTVTDGDSSLIGWWKFDETSGNVAYDSSIYGNDLTLSGTSTFTPNARVGGGAWEGLADGFAGNIALDFAAAGLDEQITVSFWAYGYQSSSRMGMLEFGTGAGELLNLYYFRQSKKPRLSGLAGSNDGSVNDAGITGQWQHWVITHNAGATAVPNAAAGAWTVYVNGQSYPGLSGTATGSFAAASSLRIGSRSASLDPYNGRIDEVRIYSRILSASEIAALGDPDAVPVTHTLDITATNGSVSKSPDLVDYPDGSTVDLTATPDTGYIFSGWSGDASGTNNPLTVTMDASKAITAEFVVAGGGPTLDVLEEWTYDGVSDGTVLNGMGTESLTGTGNKWSPGNSGSFGVVSNQMQRWEATGYANESAFSSLSHASYAGVTSGVYEVSFEVISADFSGTAGINGTAQFGYGLRSTTNGTADARALFFVDGANNRTRLSITSAVGTQFVEIENGVVLSDVLKVRLVYDLDNRGALGSFRVFTTLGAGAEVEHLAGQLQLVADFQIDQFRQQFQALNGNHDWLPGDVATVDHILLAKVVQGEAATPASLYDEWVAGYPGLGSNTNVADNLAHYAFGSDPTGAPAGSNWPAHQLRSDGGSNYIDYVYTRRVDAAERGLDYYIELGTNLVSGIWTNDTSRYTVSGADVDAEWHTITNRVPVVDERLFIRTVVEYMP